MNVFDKTLDLTILNGYIYAKVFSCKEFFIGVQFVTFKNARH